MKSRLPLALVFTGLVSSLSAHAVSPQSGSSFSTGPSSNHYSLFSASSNPAMTSFMVDEDKRFRMNYLPGVAVSVELGKVDNFADDLDELIDIIDDPDSSTETPDAVRDRFNRVLIDMGREGYIKNELAVRAPILPLFFKVGEKGSLGLDFSATADIALRVLDDELIYDEPSESFVTNTSLYLKSGLETTFALSYSHLVWDGDSQLYVGAKAKFIRLELSKQVTMLQDLDGREVEDVLSDEYDRNLVSTSNIGLDVGLIWDASKYRLGLTLENANSPEFDYGTVGVNCNERPDNTAERNSCEVTTYFVQQGRLRSNETHTKHALLRADGLLKISDTWFLSSAIDLASFDDSVGFENQWFHAATSKEFRNWFLSSARLGYKTNLVGSELAAATAGITLFKALTLDLEYGFDSVTVEDSTIPRRLGFALGFEQRF